jgi:16S rRNA (guanine966-N2)-methyltransferase
LKRPLGQLRIIGGEWRSRRVDFDAQAGVRPTPDRVRQTLFDWLSPLIDGARVLDLFAGSGALGLEALSRRAAHADFVEHGRVQGDHIEAALAALSASRRAAVIRRDALEYLRTTPSRYDIVFLDPPYDTNLLDPVLGLLPRVLLPVNRIYLEWRKGQVPSLPTGYAHLKEKTAGQVSYGLITFSEAAT